MMYSAVLIYVFDKQEYMREYRKINADKLHQQMRKYSRKQRDERRGHSPRSYSKRGKYSTSQELYKDANFRRKYKLTLDQVNSMIVAQDHRCAICLEKLGESRDTHVDHDHKTGKIRQILCRGCNHGIGNFKENMVILQRAVDYLKRWN